ncbi:unnamed protein product [Moneuplotes crassus]|uniref:Uncharacterized protein n=2 Tax=Euplotes crassus TaxID=5936 RepID=A0AAD1UNB8_EUPCR|nr:unnamed protein product [Moneuplotes crassus]
MFTRLSYRILAPSVRALRTNLISKQSSLCPWLTKRHFSGQISPYSRELNTCSSFGYEEYDNALYKVISDHKAGNNVDKAEIQQVFNHGKRLIMNGTFLWNKPSNCNVPTMINLLYLCNAYTKDFELMTQISLHVFEAMNVMTLKQIASVCRIMLTQQDLFFRKKFRNKLTQKVLHTDIKSIDASRKPTDYDLTFEEAVNVMRAFRNVIHDYQIWLKVDLLIKNAFMTDPNVKNMSKDDLMDTINTLAYKEVQNIDTWQFLTTHLVECMMADTLNLHDLMSACISIKSVSVKSPELYEMLVGYFSYKEYTVEDLLKYKNTARIIKFFNSIGTMHGSCNNEYFLTVMRDYISHSINDFDRFQVKISMDLFKFFVHFEDEHLKNILAERWTELY